MKKVFMHIASMVASLAIFVGISSVNSPSFVIFHQPKVPTGLEKYRK